MQHLEVSGAVRPLKWSLGVKWLVMFSLQVRPNDISKFQTSCRRTQNLW